MFRFWKVDCVTYNPSLLQETQLFLLTRAGWDIAIWGGSHQFVEHISQMNNFLGCGAGVDWLAENRERYLLLEQVWLWEVHWNFSVQPLWWSALAAIQNSLFRASEWFIVEWYKRCQFQIMNLFLKYFWLVEGTAT